MSYGENVTINPKHKDRLFNFIFGKEENRKWTLSLYNAVNGSDHDDESMIEFNAWFIDEIRKNRKEHDTESSVRLAIEAMPDDCIIKGFLTGHMKEVEGMLDTEYNEAEVKELFKEEGREEGREQEVTERIQDMLRRGKTVAEITDFCGYPKEQVEKVEKSMLTMAE